jgi:hypothetical protein
MISEAHRLGMKVIPWTVSAGLFVHNRRYLHHPLQVNSLDRVEELVKDGADGIITDCTFQITTSIIDCSRKVYQTQTLLGGGPNNRGFRWRLNILHNVSSPAYTSACISLLDAMH